MDADSSGQLRLGHLLQAAGLNPVDVVVLRHTPKALASKQAKAYGESLREYVSEQDRFIPKLSAAKVWLNFLGTTGRFARLINTYENQGEMLGKRQGGLRYYDLQDSSLLTAYAGRLVIEWTADPVNWAKTGAEALAMSVIEIADRSARPFPGFDSIIVSYEELQAIMIDDGYAEWRTALSSVKGIYLIADTRTSQLYVGKADGAAGFLGRWGEYADNGHGGNVALRELDTLDPSHRDDFQFSILQVFSPNAPAAQIDAAEVHYKKALLTRRGLNRN